MDKIYEQTMLFDFYGELLTEHQRAVYADALYNDMSLGEIAEERGISRQGVHDLVKRCDKILRDYEGKLHLVERFNRARETVRQIQELSEAAQGTGAVSEAGDASEASKMEATPEAAGERELRGRLRRIGVLSKELLEEL